ncbi:MAG: PIN domain-containing protein [Acidimicrobiia bacterium]
MRVLLDTNVLVSGLLSGGIPRHVLRLAIRGEVALITSSILTRELEEVLVEKFGFPAEAGRAIPSELEALAVVIEPEGVP